MLRDIQGSLSARGLNEGKKEEQDEMTAGRPPFVNLLWVVRNRDELQLLDQDLLMTAGYFLSLIDLHAKSRYIPFRIFLGFLTA